MAPRLGRTRVIDDPHARRIVFLQQHRQHLPRDRAKQPLIAPVGIGHQVVHRLMRRAHVVRLHARGHRLHALPAPGKHQRLQIPLRRCSSVGVAERLSHHVAVTLETRFDRLSHVAPPPEHEDADIIACSLTQ
jgi:hypothetical protein